MKNISVENAIKRAWLLRWLGIVITVVPPFIVMIYVGVNDLNPWYVLYGYIMFFVVGFAFANFTTLRWRIWAFSNVRNIHLLRKLAREDYFIHDGKKWIEKFEFPSIRHKAEWTNLQERFKIADEYIEDFTIPAVHTIRKNVVYIVFNNLLPLVLYLVFWIVIFFYFKEEVQTKLGLVLLCIIILSCVIFIFSERKNIMRLFDDKVQLQIDSDGITIDSSIYYSWQEITDVTVVPYYIEGDTRRRVFALAFKFQDKDKFIPLYYYKVNRFEMLNILQTFKIRSGYK